LNKWDLGVVKPPHAEGRQLLVQEDQLVQTKAGSFFLDKYLMNTYQASVRAQVKGRSQVIKTEVRAMNTQEARWLLWAQFGFHSIQVGPVKV
jgi:hypothetical protein